jgi:cation:H+ antiporter
MIFQMAQLSMMLMLILAASHLFTNAIEYMGEKLGVSEGMTGSIFAAIATALPETCVPVVAIIAGTSDKQINQEISVGAILGAPLMLSTLSTVLLALSALRTRGINGKIVPEKSGFVRDINFFLCAFSASAIAMFVPHHPVYLRAVMSLFLVFLYIYYLVMTLRASRQLVTCGHSVMTDEPLLLTKLGLKNNTGTILLQLIASLGLLLLASKGFINSIAAISKLLSLSALVLSLLIIPIGTELPEKVNSILWIRKNKDTLGFGNITGAMVFQGTLLPALGIMLTPWRPGPEVMTGIVITLLSALWLRANASTKGVRISALMVNGGFYLAYLYFTLA